MLHELVSWPVLRRPEHRPRLSPRRGCPIHSKIGLRRPSLPLLDWRFHAVQLVAQPFGFLLKALQIAPGLLLFLFELVLDGARLASLRTGPVMGFSQVVLQLAYKGLGIAYFLAKLLVGERQFFFVGPR